MRKGHAGRNLYYFAVTCIPEPDIVPPVGQRKSGVAFEEWALLAEIRAEMGRRGWNRDRMARESGMPATNVYRYFMKATRSPSPSDLFAAAKALGVPLSELAERAEAVSDARLPRDVAAWLADQGDLDPETQALAEHIRPKRDPGEGRRASGH